MAVLSREAVQERLRDLPGWELAERALRREFQFKTFRQAMAFVNAVAERAQAARHHPDIFISYNRVVMTLTTHSEGGVTEKDLDLARAIDEVVSRQEG
ncbi:MAG TPA: 4a-hydroxytetrahydrobiopterin dehydratase [Chloroflexota bacterium]|jgi:4a-hydroxytetrahydrobiopterin dehydratase